MVKKEKMVMFGEIMDEVEKVAKLRATLTHATRNAKANEINGDEDLQENLDKRVEDAQISYFKTLRDLESEIKKAMGLTKSNESSN